jgi:succinate-acetate transporter protein
MKSQSSNRSFGILFFLVFLILSLWPLKSGNNLNFYFFVISVIFLILGALNSKLLSPLNKAWIKFGEILGLIIAPIVMSLVYFVILTPVSLIVRLFGKDLLGLKFIKENESYWMKRKKKLNSMDKQF